MKTIMRLNAMTVVAIMLLLFGHGILAAGTALGFWSFMGLPLAKVAYFLIYVHLVLVTIRTLQMFVPELKSMATMKEFLAKNGGVWQGFVKMFAKAEIGKKMKRQNRHFWMTRLTGVVFLVLVFVHKAWMWAGPSQTGLLKAILLWLQIMFIVAIFAHIIINIRPLMAKFGLGNRVALQNVVKIFLYFLMLFICGGMGYYYFR